MCQCLTSSKALNDGSCAKFLTYLAGPMVVLPYFQRSNVSLSFFLVLERNPCFSLHISCLRFICGNTERVWIWARCAIELSTQVSEDFKTNKEHKLIHENESQKGSRIWMITLISHPFIVICLIDRKKRASFYFTDETFPTMVLVIQCEDTWWCSIAIECQLA